MPADSQAVPFTREPLTPFAREQLWQAVRARRGVMVGNLVFTSLMGVILALLPAAAIYLFPIEVPFRIGLGVLALAGAAVTIAQARMVLRIFGPYLQAIWRGQGLRAALPPTSVRESRAAFAAEVWFAGIGKDGGDYVVQLELPERFGAIFGTHVQDLMMLPRPSAMQFHVAPWGGPRKVLYALHQPDEPAPVVYTAPMAGWPLPPTEWSMAEFLVAVALMLLGAALAACLALVSGAHPYLAVLLLIVAGGGGFCAGGQGLHHGARLWRRRGAAPQMEVLQGRAQGVLHFRWSLPAKGGASIAYLERWMLLGNQWHRLVRLPTADYAPAVMPPLPEVIDGVRLEYAVWGRERRLMRAFTAGEAWIGGELMPDAPC